MTTQATSQIEQLNDRYDVIGELAGRDDSQRFMARVRESGADVLVSVVRTPAGDEGNALSHFASDAKRLAELAHRGLVTVVEARWLETDVLALVTERVSWPTLDELVIRRDEEFACTRVATILRDINAVLEWARNRKIVHRGLDLGTIHVEPGSDRVLLSFAIRPLPLSQMPGAEQDARTIATLARAMLTRSVADPERDQVPLGELRPGLPDRLIEQTEQLLQLDAKGRVPDVTEYIAIVAMSDNLKRSETECAETTRKLLEEERVAREKLEAQHRAAEEAAAEQARLFQLEREEFAREREKLLAELRKDGEALQRERDLLAAERADHEKDRALLLSEREEHRRWADEVERAFEAQSALLEKQRQEHISAVAAATEASAAAAELHATATPDATPALALPPRPRTKWVPPDWARSVARSMKVRRKHLPAWNRKWNVPLASAVLLLLIVTVGVALAGRSGSGSAPAIASAPTPRVVDSAAGGVSTAPPIARPASVPGIPEDFVTAVSGRRPAAAGVPADLVGGVRARRDSGSVVPPTLERAGDPRPAATPPRTTSSTEPSTTRPALQPRTAAPAPVDTAFRAPAPVVPNPQPFGPPVVPTTRPDSAARRDTLARPRPDTVPRDTMPVGLRR